MNQKPVKSPTGFEDNLPALLGNFADEVAKTCLLSVKIAQMVSKTATRKLNIAV